MKKLVINQDGKVTLDGSEIPKKDINGNFLNLLFQRALKGEVEFFLDETDPISKLFTMIKEETHPESEFSKQVQNLRDSYTESVEEKKMIESAETEDDLPF